MPICRAIPSSLVFGYSIGNRQESPNAKRSITTNCGPKPQLVVAILCVKLLRMAMDVIQPIFTPRTPYFDLRPSSEDTAIAFERPRRRSFGPSDQELSLQGYRTPQTMQSRPTPSESELQKRVRCRANLTRIQKKIQAFETAGRLGLANHERQRLFGSQAARVTAASRELRHYRRKHPTQPLR